jgi:hypothetical protein
VSLKRPTEFDTMTCLMEATRPRPF